jgi:hypothetical protein
MILPPLSAAALAESADPIHSFLPEFILCVVTWLEAEADLPVHLAPVHKLTNLTRAEVEALRRLADDVPADQQEAREQVIQLVAQRVRSSLGERLHLDRARPNGV